MGPECSVLKKINKKIYRRKKKKKKKISWTSASCEAHTDPAWPYRRLLPFAGRERRRMTKDVQKKIDNTKYQLRTPRCMAAGSDWQQRTVERGRPVAGWWLIQYSRLPLFLYRFRPFSSRLRWIARSWSLLLLASGSPPLTSASSSAVALMW